jgi:hypothetical protein
VNGDPLVKSRKAIGLPALLIFDEPEIDTFPVARIRTSPDTERTELPPIVTFPR